MQIEFILPEYWIDMKFPDIVTDRYRISNTGKIVDVISGKGILVHYSEKGYAMVRLYNTVKKRAVTKKLHRVVAYNFLGAELFNLMTVNHITGDKEDNSVSNLEYMTFADNIKHSFLTGLNVGLKGEANGSSKTTEQNVNRICEYLNTGLSSNKIVAKFLEEDIVVSKYVVDDIRIGKTWRHVSSKYGISV